MHAIEYITWWHNCGLCTVYSSEQLRVTSTCITNQLTRTITVHVEMYAVVDDRPNPRLPLHFFHSRPAQRVVLRQHILSIFEFHAPILVARAIWHTTVISLSFIRFTSTTSTIFSVTVVGSAVCVGWIGRIWNRGLACDWFRSKEGWIAIKEAESGAIGGKKTFSLHKNKDDLTLNASLCIALLV